MKQKIQIVEDAIGNKIVVLQNIVFKNKQNIDWNAVKKYLQRYVGEIVTITEFEDIIHIGSEFPDEFKGSNYTKHLKGANAKAKANAAQGIIEMLMIATEKHFSKNHKTKHSTTAGNGWYYYTTRFAIPLYQNNAKLDIYNIYSARIIINCTKFGTMYLYDLIDIKKETSTPLKTI